ncbi:selenocysteine-specific translation elongation factor [Dongshaea marina]|uniref:selenocysteine-specific translation elongation factor n=1 Tax=Dongshaea marina TaxID=2047966 RepID=UPI000D3E69CE|nr:selenocysteine-specific translation elongation factor [Dongshaea marina]
MNNFVIGTAGHVDHGKTALIHALTGIETSHLPQEKQRGMTIDLGFAHFNDNQGRKIGVIDVPGHERFIRNMVAGVWSLDLVLFVVAADEGWSAMSHDHLKVIASLGINNIILVINKSDLVTPQELVAVEEQALEQFIEQMDLLPQSVCVSSLTGQGIDKLQQTIERTLDEVERQPVFPLPHLYVDRIFTINGIGTTVTGSLCGGSLKIGDQLNLSPQGMRVQIKSLHAYHQHRESVDSVSRVAIGLKGVKKRELQRGACLHDIKAACETSSDLLIRIENPLKLKRRQCEIEVAIGTAHTLARLYLLGDGRLARLQLTTPCACFWGQRIVLIRHGGSQIIGAGQLVWSQSVARQDRARLQSMLESLPAQLTQADYASLQLKLHGFTRAPGQDSEILSSQQFGEYLVSHHFLDSGSSRLFELLESAHGSSSLPELASKTHWPMPIIEILVAQLIEQGKVSRSGETCSVGGGQNLNTLPEEAQQLFELIFQAGTQGFEANKASIPGLQKNLRLLTREALILHTQDKIYFDQQSYLELVSRLLKGRKPDERFSIAMAREATGLARKQLIPLLNRIEQDGWVRRDESERVVLKTLSEKVIAD